MVRRIGWWRLATFASAVGLVAAACDTQREPALTEPEASIAAATLSMPQAQQVGQQFARALAVTLDQPGTRGVLHAAMRDSPLNEHKLVLQDFAATGPGNRLVKAMAAANGVDESVVRGWIGQLPAMDFYVPFVEHRRTWTGTGDVVVGSNMDVDQTRFTGYTPEGTSLALDTRDGTPAQTVIFLHPAEPKGIRPRASTSSDYASIEDPNAPEYTTMSIDPGDAEPNLSTNPVATYVGRLYQFKNYEGDGIGGIELLVKHYAGRNGTRIDEQLMAEGSAFTWTGYEYDDVTTPNRAINFASYGDTWIKVYERDSGAESGWGLDGSDFWGEGKFGGFNVKHRFSLSGVTYPTYPGPCYTNPANCGESATVELWYQSDPNQPPAGTGGFASGDLANYTVYNTSSAWSIVNGHLTANSTARQSIVLRNGVTITDGWVETETDQALDGGLVVRSQANAGNHYLLAIRDDSRYGHANIQIYKAVNGAYTALTSQLDLSFPRGTNKKIRFEAQGSSLKAYFDGALVAQATDATWTSGLLGLRANHSNSTDQTRFAVLRWNVVSPTDNFNDASSLNNYTLVNTPEAWSVSNGHLVAGSGARQATALRNGVTIENGWVETRTDQAADGGLVARAQNLNSYYLLAIRDDSRFGHANIEIYKAVNGTFTSLSGQIDISFPVGTQKTIRFQASGTTLTAYVNGAQVAQVSDASFTSGMVGLRASGRDGETLTSRFDYFTFSQQ
jgi:hypothetical protein